MMEWVIVPAESRNQEKEDSLLYRITSHLPNMHTNKRTDTQKISQSQAKINHQNDSPHQVPRGVTAICRCTYFLGKIQGWCTGAITRGALGLLGCGLR